MTHRVIINFKDVLNFVEYFKETFSFDQKLIEKKMHQYLMAEHENVTVISPDDVKKFFADEEIPVVIQKAIANNEKIYSIAFTNTFKNKVSDLNDYFLHAKEQGVNISGMPFAVALTNSDKWHKSFGKKKRKVSSDLQGLRVLEKFDDGSFLAKLLSKEQYDYEGQMMNHCVSSYFDKKSTNIMSYRDAQNKPMMTIEYQRLDNGNKIIIHQARGFANKDFIDERYVSNTLAYFYKKYKHVQFHDSYIFGPSHKGRPILSLPEGFVFNGSMHIDDCVGLPKNSVFTGNLTLVRGRMQLLKDIEVKGNITINNSKIYAIDDSVKVDGEIAVQSSLVFAVAKSLKSKITK